MSKYVDVRTAAELIGEAPQRVREKIEAGAYAAVKRKGDMGGGDGGESYLIKVSSLPKIAQIAYSERLYCNEMTRQCDLVGYQARYGEAGIDELMQRQRAAQEGNMIRRLSEGDATMQLHMLAAEHAVTLRTLYRWMNAYDTQHLRGIMRAMNRKDKGTAPSICPAAQNHAYRLFADQRKRTHATIFRKLREKAAELGPNACKSCYCNADTDARRQLEAAGQAADYPLCDDPDKKGMRIPACRQTLSRILAAIPADEATLARRGQAAWKNDHMLMATREKPAEVNRVWFGDHHQLDAFVLDEKGKAVRPWMTAWYDAGTGCLVGWVLCTNPNTETIIEAFVRAIAYTMHSPFFGPPAAIYVDNGKDYRSKVFETGILKEYDLGKLNSDVGKLSVLQLLNVHVHHAVPYHAWSKTVERFFGTFEDIWMREVPGWCAGNTKDRPENFSKDIKRMLERGGLWTLDQMYAYIRDTVLPEYHARPHQGHGDKAPMELYNTLPRARHDQPDWDVLALARKHMTERKISQSGIRFKNELYWHDNMIGLAGQDAVIRYSPSGLSSVTVMVDGRFLCEAPVKERLALIDAPEEQLGLHMSKQKRQKRDTTDRIKWASRSMFADEVDPKRTGGTITSLEAHKAARARTRLQEQRNSEPIAAGGDAASAMFQALGDSVINQA